MRARMRHAPVGDCKDETHEMPSDVDLERRKVNKLTFICRGK